VCSSNNEATEVKASKYSTNSDPRAARALSKSFALTARATSLVLSKVSIKLKGTKSKSEPFQRPP